MSLRGKGAGGKLFDGELQPTVYRKKVLPQRSLSQPHLNEGHCLSLSFLLEGERGRGLVIVSALVFFIDSEIIMPLDAFLGNP